MDNAHVFDTLFDALNAISHSFVVTKQMVVLNNSIEFYIKKESMECYYKNYTDLDLDDIKHFTFEIKFISKYKNTGKVTISLCAGSKYSILLTTQDLLHLGLLNSMSFGDED